MALSKFKNLFKDDEELENSGTEDDTIQFLNQKL